MQDNVFVDQIRVDLAANALARCRHRLRINQAFSLRAEAHALDDAKTYERDRIWDVETGQAKMILLAAPDGWVSLDYQGRYRDADFVFLWIRSGLSTGFAQGMAFCG